jgi:alanyl-tRNA synthetase
MGKKKILEFFQKKPERFYKVKLFDELGFKRKQCKNCGKFFWTLTDQEICNDSTCRPYEFIGNPPTKKPLDYFETWQLIEKFFGENGHTALKSYPVVCRWFPLYFTIAGIVDFYRLTDSKLDFEFPANPVILPQICLRFNDLANTGVNSRSYTCFGMVQQSSLFDGKQGYWKDECIELDFRLLTEAFGIKPEEIVFIEDAWLGPSAFGACLEYHVQGLELGNAVFTEFVGNPESFVEMEKKVVDMGAGWERFTWITQGTPTSYDCVFGPVVEKLKKLCGLKEDKSLRNYWKLAGLLSFDEASDPNTVRKLVADRLGVPSEDLEKKVSKFETVYALADHTRAIVFAISDLGIPSNVGGGYNLRVILRRAFDFVEKLGLSVKVEEIASWHIDYLKKMFPHLEDHREEIEKIVEVEEERYKKTKEKSKRIIESLAGKELSEEELIKIYESEGITPESLGVKVPPLFYAKLTQKHEKPAEVEERFPFDVSTLQPTKILYYRPIYEFDATVLKASEDLVVLDQTAFYPTSGGQAHDTGYIDNIKVKEVIKAGKVILHRIEGSLEEGKKVHCKIDKDRREILKQHHTATHIVNAAARKVLGEHVWQHSAYKDVDKARLDITHYDALSEEEVEKIEAEANKIIRENLPVSIQILPRGEAEQKYSFRIYQGGVVPEKELRIVSIGDVDHEACGGLHCNSTGEVGCISILRTKRVQDGVVRLEYCSGSVAISYLKEMEKILREVAKKLEVSEEKVPEAVDKLFKEWKSKRKELKKRKVSK